MPEGDTILKLALRIGPMLRGKTLVDVACRWPRLVEGARGLVVDDVRAQGKHMLVVLSDGSALRVHLGMTGSWRRTDPDEPLGRSEKFLGLLLATDEDVLACYRPAEVERVDPRALPTHEGLTRLGPDLLVDPLDLDEVVRRARLHDDEAIADVLLDQSVAAGVGNVYKSETLFVERVDPFTPVRALDDAKLRSIWARAAKLMRANIDGPMRTTTAMPRRYWVYGAGRAPCMRCRGPVRYAKQGPHLRGTWWCPRCQPRVDEVSAGTAR